MGGTGERKCNHEPKGTFPKLSSYSYGLAGGLEERHCDAFCWRVLICSTMEGGAQGCCCTFNTESSSAGLRLASLLSVQTQI